MFVCVVLTVCSPEHVNGQTTNDKQRARAQAIGTMRLSIPYPSFRLTFASPLLSSLGWGESKENARKEKGSRIPTSPRHNDNVRNQPGRNAHHQFGSAELGDLETLERLRQQAELIVAFEQKHGAETTLSTVVVLTPPSCSPSSSSSSSTSRSPTKASTQHQTERPKRTVTSGIPRASPPIYFHPQYLVPPRHSHENDIPTRPSSATRVSSATSSATSRLAVHAQTNDDEIKTRDDTLARLDHYNPAGNLFTPRTRIGIHKARSGGRSSSAPSTSIFSPPHHRRHVCKQLNSLPQPQSLLRQHPLSHSYSHRALTPRLDSTSMPPSILDPDIPIMPGLVWGLILLGLAIGVIWTLILGGMVFWYRPLGWRTAKERDAAEGKKKAKEGEEATKATKSDASRKWNFGFEFGIGYGRPKKQGAKGREGGKDAEKAESTLEGAVRTSMAPSRHGVTGNAAVLNTHPVSSHHPPPPRQMNIPTLVADQAITSATPRHFQALRSAHLPFSMASGQLAVPRRRFVQQQQTSSVLPTEVCPICSRRPDTVHVCPTAQFHTLPSPPSLSPLPSFSRPPSNGGDGAIELAVMSRNPFEPERGGDIVQHQSTETLNNQAPRSSSSSSSSSEESAAQTPLSPDNPFLPPRHLLRPRSSKEYLSAHRAFFADTPNPPPHLLAPPASTRSSPSSSSSSSASLPLTQQLQDASNENNGSNSKYLHPPSPSISAAHAPPPPPRPTSPSPSPSSSSSNSSTFSYVNLDTSAAALEAQNPAPIQDLEAQTSVVPKHRRHRRVLSKGSFGAGGSEAGAPVDHTEAPNGSPPAERKKWSGMGLLEAVDDAVTRGVDRMIKWTEQGDGDEGLLLPLRD